MFLQQTMSDQSKHFTGFGDKQFQQYRKFRLEILDKSASSHFHLFYSSVDKSRIRQLIGFLIPSSRGKMMFTPNILIYVICSFRAEAGD